MKKQDVKVGMKVVPFRKTAKRWCKLSKSFNWSKAKEANQPFLYVGYFDAEEDAWALMFNKRKFGGDFFRSSDFRPYEPPV